ncbi:hypothetical protein Tco_0040839 [Tanacetum coccineum]
MLLNTSILRIAVYKYAVSIKEDTGYLCLDSPKTTKDTRPIRRIQERQYAAGKDLFSVGTHNGYQSLCPQLDHEHLEQLDEFDLEEMDLKWQVDMISMRIKKFYNKTDRAFARECRTKGNQDGRRKDTWNSRNKDGRRSGKQEDSKALVTIDGEGVDWTSHSEEEEDYALMACNSSGSDTEVISCSKECKESYAKLKKLYDEQRAQLSDASIEIKAYTQALKKVEAKLVSPINKSNFVLKTGNYMPSGPDIEIDYLQFTYGPKQSQPSESETQTSDFDTCESDCSVETHESLPEPTVNEPKVVSQPKVWSDAPIIEEYESDSEDEHVSLPTEEQETPSFANQQVKTPRETVKNQFTHSKNPKVDKKGLGYGFTTKACFVCGSLSHLIRDCDFHEKRMAKQVELNKKKGKDNVQRENKPVWNNVQRVNHKNQFVPRAVLTRTGKIPVSTARASGTNNVSTARHNFKSQVVLTSTVKPFVNRVRPKTVFHKTHSPFRRNFNNTTAPRTNFSKQKVNTAEDYPYRTLQNKVIVDSGCSRHITGNKAYLVEYQDFNGGPVAFGGSKGYITGKAVYAEVIESKFKIELRKVQIRRDEMQYQDESQIQKQTVFGKDKSIPLMVDSYDIEDMYLLIVNSKLGMESYQQKVNLTAPIITFPGIEKYKVFFIVFEPVYSIIYKNNKKEKRVMRHQEIHKFCDATLKRVLEGLKSYNNNVKHGYVTPSLSKDDVEYMQLFE